MAGAKWICAPLLAILCLLVPTTSAAIDVVALTWNVAHGDNMSQPIFEKELSEALNIGSGQLPVVIAIALQEMCWKCSHLPLVGERLKTIVNSHVGADRYQVVSISSTNTLGCEIGCSITHGTNALVVLSPLTANDVKSKTSTSGCSGKFPNPEKGVSAIRLSVNGVSLCVAGAHLASTSPDPRMSCVKGFFKGAAQKIDWDGCTHKIFMGDLNMRTGKDSKNGTQESFNYFQQAKSTSDPAFQQLRQYDEMNGQTPWTTTSGCTSWLSCVNGLVASPLEEYETTFWPSYKLAGGEYCFNPSINKVCLKIDGLTGNCHGRQIAGKVGGAGDGDHCFVAERSPAWTDRIIHSGFKKTGKSYYGQATNAVSSDHYPVVAHFEF